MPYWKPEISVTLIQLHLRELYSECYPQTLAPRPEMKARSYTVWTFRCSINLFWKSWWVTHGSLFFLSCLHHHTREVLWIQLTTSAFWKKNKTRADCHVINYKFTNLACSRLYWEILALSHLCMDLANSQSTLPLPRANVPQYCPCAQVLRSK